MMRTSLLTVYYKKWQAACEQRDPSQWVKGHDKKMCVKDHGNANKRHLTQETWGQNS